MMGGNLSHFTSGDFLCFPTIGHYTIPHYVQDFLMSKCSQHFGTYQTLQHRYKIGQRSPIWRDGKSILVNVSKHEVYPLSQNVESIGWSARMDWRELDSWLQWLAAFAKAPVYWLPTTKALLSLFHPLQNSCLHWTTNKDNIATKTDKGLLA